MEQANVAMAMLQTAASAAQLPKAGKNGGTDEFQKLLEEKSQAKDPLVEERPKAGASTKTTTAKKPGKAPAQQEEDPAESSKRLQAYLVPLTQEQLSQIPAQYLPEVQEGEPIVCIGVQTGEDGEDIPVLVGAGEAAQRYGKQVILPEQPVDAGAPETDAILEATGPDVEHGPAKLLEEAASEEDGRTTGEAVKEAQPQAARDDTDTQVEVVDAEQAPQRIFHDVETVPVKVGESYEPEQADEADVVKQVDAALVQALQKGESTVSVRLTPENLGEVTVQVSMKNGGILAVAISARNDDTRALLERHAGNLQELLGSRVRESVQVEIQRQPESQQSQNQQQSYDGHNGHANGGQEQRRPRREHTGSQDFMQQLRLGLIPADGEF